MIVTSFVVTLLAGLIAAPFALIIALAINEIFPKWFGKILQPIIELLVGVPSVVYGFKKYFWWIRIWNFSCRSSFVYDDFTNDGFNDG